MYNALIGTFFGDDPVMRTALEPFLRQIDFRALGVGATVALMFVSARLFLMVERAYNDIFEVRIERALPRRVLNFYFAVTAVPLVIMATLETTIRLDLTQWQSPLVSALQLTLLVAALKMFPNIHVRWAPATLGAAVTWLLLQLGTYGFSAYIRYSYASDDYPLRTFYGSLFLVPVFLLWLYIVWLVVLLGVEVAHLAQNYTSLVQAEHEAAERERRVLRAPALDNALELLAHITRRFHSGDGAATLDWLAEQMELPRTDLAQVAEVLCDASLLVAAGEGFLLARPAAQLQLSEIARIWRASTLLAGGEESISAEVSDALRLHGTLEDAAARWLAPDEIVAH